MEKAVQFIPVSEPNLCGREAEYATDAVQSTWISSTGPYIDRFEKNFAAYIGSRHAIPVFNGTVALHLALVAIGIQPGDEVIVPNVTFIATANAVRYLGATPVFADIDPLTWNIDLRSIKRLLTPKTRAIIPVHLYGQPVDMDALQNLARQHDLEVIEDAAEALGTEFRGRKAGNLARISTFSLYGNKTMTTGEGGVITTSDDALAAKIRLLKNQGMSPSRRYWFDDVGYNYRMTNVQAAIGCAQLENLESFVRRKIEIASWYDQLLDQSFTRPARTRDGINSHWMTSALVPTGVDRDAFCRGLRDWNIDSRPFFYPLSTMPPYADHRAELSDETRDLASRGINLPSSTKITQEQVEYIARVCNSLVR